MIQFICLLKTRFSRVNLQRIIRTTFHRLKLLDLQCLNKKFCLCLPLQCRNANTILLITQAMLFKTLLLQQQLFRKHRPLPLLTGNCQYITRDLLIFLLNANIIYIKYVSQSENPYAPHFKCKRSKKTGWICL